MAYSWLYRLRAFLNRRSREASMDAEMRYHLECETNARIVAGMTPDEARRTALRDFGGIDRHKEDARDQRGFRALEELAYDARHTLRSLRRNPGYTTAAVLTFALGIGLTTAIYSVVHGVLLRPLPYASPDRLAVVWERNASRAAETNVVSVSNFEAWRERARAFSALAGIVPAPRILNAENPARVMGAEVSPGYFHLLGVLPAVGRDFDEREISGNANAVILSDGLWRSRFGADRTIVGRTISLDERPHTIVGVMPRDFDPPRFGWLSEQELWLPFVASENNRSWGRFLLVVGRLRDGVSLDAARRDMEAVAGRLSREVKADEGWSATVVGLAEQITGDVRRPLLVLLIAVGLLLVMAATNVGSLMLGFLRRRQQELAVRRAIGAGTSRIFRQVVTHSVVLGVLGAAVGLAAAIAGTRFLVSMMPPDVPRSSSIHLDGAVLLFTSSVVVLSTIVLAVVVALRGAPGGARSSLVGRAQSNRATARMGSGSLVIAEIALGVVLTVLAGLMVRSFVNLRSVNLGFDGSSVVAGRISLPTLNYGSDARQRTFFDAFGERLRAIPGVHAVSFATTRPFACCAPATVVRNPAEPVSAGVEPPTADVRYVDSAFFAALRIPLVRGPGFSAREPTSEGVPPRVVINQALARAFWPDLNPVGRQLYIEMFNGLTAQVVGVVGDVHLSDARTPARATVYLSAEAYPSTIRDVIVRGEGRPDALVNGIRGALRAMDATLPLYLVTTMDDAIDRSLAQDRFTTLILGVFATVSLLLAAVGIYGAFAAEVTARQKEIGVRLALGARGSRVLLLVLRRGLALAMIGAALGVGAGLLLSRSMAALMFGVPTSDPLSFAGVAALLLAVAVLATLVPAWRAARTSPLTAIRSD